METGAHFIRLLAAANCIAALLLAGPPAGAAVFHVPGDVSSLAATAGADHPFVNMRMASDPATVTTATKAPSYFLPTCTEGQIDGTVTTAQGAPVMLAAVEALDARGATVSSFPSDAAGVYRLCVPFGEYAVEFSHADYVTSYFDNRQYGCATPVVVSASSPTAVADAALIEPGSISGRITDEHGTPLEWYGARAEGTDHLGDGTDVADAAGNYLITGLPPGSYTVRFSSPANGRLTYYPGTPPSSAVTVTVTAGQKTTGINAVHGPLGQISGTVKQDLPPNLPVPGCPVELNHEDGSYFRFKLTDAGGNYLFSEVPYGSYKIFFDCATQGFQPEWHPGTGDWETAGTVEVSSPAGAADVDALVAAGGSISGTVMDGASPVTGNYVSANDSSGYPVDWTYTDGAGAFLFEGLPAGSYRIYSWGNFNGYGNEWYDNAAGFGDATPVTVAPPGAVTGIEILTSPLNAAGAAGRLSFEGPVCSGYHDIMAFAPTDINDWWSTGYTSAGPLGDWEMDNLPPGTYRFLGANFNGRHGKRWYRDSFALALANPVAVSAGQTKPKIDITLPDPETGPVPDISIADQGGEPQEIILTMGRGDRQPISLSLDCNEAKGKPMDYWLAASTPLGFYSYDRVTKTWIPGLTPSFQGPCVQLSNFGITELPFVPVNGPVDIYFAVDSVQNGVLDPRSLAGDAVRASMPR